MTDPGTRTFYRPVHPWGYAIPGLTAAFVCLGVLGLITEKPGVSRYGQLEPAERAWRFAGVGLILAAGWAVRPRGFWVEVSGGGVERHGSHLSLSLAAGGPPFSLRWDEVREWAETTRLERADPESLGEDVWRPVVEIVTVAGQTYQLDQFVGGIAAELRVRVPGKERAAGGVR